MPIRSKWFAGLLAITLCSQAHADLSSSQKEAKERGLVLYNQYKPAAAELKIAAEAGDAESQYYLGEELRQQKQYITAEAQKWYEAAALQGDLYAMLRLATSNNDLCEVMNNCPEGTKKRTDWLELLNKESEQKADNGDGEAMYIKYLSSGQLELSLIHI